MAINIDNNISYQLSLNVLKALGGNTDVSYETVDDIWDEINAIYDNAGDRLDIEALILDIQKNGVYEYYPTETADAYSPVKLNVNIPQKYTEEYIQELEKSVFQEGYNEGNEVGYKDGYTAGNTDGFTDGYAEGLDDGTEQQKALLSEVTVKENGVYEREDGYKKVYVEVDVPTFETEILSVELTENGTHTYTPTTDGFSSVEVSVNVEIPDVEPADLRNLIVEVKENKEYEFLPTDYDGWNKVNVTVNVPTGGGGGNGFDYSVIGWPDSFNNEVNSITSNQISESATLKDAWENAADFNVQQDITSLIRQLHFCPKVDMSKLKYAGSAKLAGVGTVYFPVQDYHIPTSSLVKSVTFQDCGKLEFIELGLQWELFTDAVGMFKNCTNLKEVPSDYVPHRAALGDLCNNCTSLTSVPEIDCSNVTYLENAFRGCSKLKNISLLNTGNVTNMSYLFYECSSLTSIPELDCSSCTSLQHSFRNCVKVENISILNTGKVTNMQYAFYNCMGLTSLPEIDCSSVTVINYMLFPNNGNGNLTTLGGFKNLGAKSSWTNTSNYFLEKQPNLTHESLMNVINGLYDRKSAGYSTVTLKFGSTNLAKLTDEEKAIATNKGWTLST